MSQQDTSPIVTLTTPLPAPSEVDVIDPESLVGTYADSLMSSLFEEVDQMLTGDLTALATVEASLTTAQDQVHLSAVVDRPNGSDLQNQSEDSSQALTTTGEDALDSWLDGVGVSDRLQTPAKSRWGYLFDHFLLASTGLSLLGLLAFFWMHQRQSALPVATPPPTPAVSQVDAEFVQYLQRSLEVIGKKADQVKSASQLGMPPAPGDLPLVPPLGLAQAGQPAGEPMVGGPINVIERIYIPYQAPGTAPALPPAAVTPGASTPSPSPGVIHRLVGVLELGDRSAALFEVNGIPQRVYIGEAIGSAGWSLVSVSREEVRMRRNGEVRSLYIGQQF